MKYEDWEGIAEVILAIALALVVAGPFIFFIILAAKS